MIKIEGETTEARIGVNWKKVYPVLNYFKNEKVLELALLVCENLQPVDDRWMALRKLLEADDCITRAGGLEQLTNKESGDD